MSAHIVSGTLFSLVLFKLPGTPQGSPFPHLSDEATESEGLPVGTRCWDLNLRPVSMAYMDIYCFCSPFNKQLPALLPGVLVLVASSNQLFQGPVSF